MKKRGYIFLIDAIFAIVILIIGFMIISSQAVPDLSETPLLLTTENVVDLLSTVKIDELCIGCDCSYTMLSDYCSDDLIKNSDQTLFDYLGELYYTGKTAEAGDLFSNITADFYRQDLFGVEVIIDGQQLYADSGRDESRELLSRKKVIFGFYENLGAGTVDFWGPYVLEVNVWSK